MFMQSPDRKGAGLLQRRFDDVVFDPAAGTLAFEGRTQQLRPRTAAVFDYLLLQSGRLVGKDELLRAVWSDAVVTEDSLTQCIKEIRRALEPARAHRIRTVPRLGYQFTAAVEIAPAAVGPAPLPAAPAVAVAPAVASDRAVTLLGAIVTLLLLAGLAGWAGWRAWTPQTPREPLSIVVLPFAAEAADAWLGQALSDDLTRQLGQTADTRVISADTARSFQGRPADPREVARALGVRYVVHGTAQRRGDEVSLAVVLTDGQTGLQRWAHEQAWPRAQLGASAGLLARQLARSLSVQMFRWSGDAAARLDPAQMAADDLAMQGWATYFRALTPDNLRSAAALFEAAARQDPGSVRAWGGVVVASGMGAVTHWAPDPAAAARRLDEALAHLQTIDADGFYSHLGRSLQAHRAGDWEAVLAINTAGVARFPSHAPTHYAIAIALTRLGRFEECLPAAAQALRIGPRDPQAGGYHLQRGLCHFHLGADRQAVEDARRAQQASPRLDIPHLLLAAALARSGEIEPARAVLADFTRRRPGFGIAQATRILHGTDTRFVRAREDLFDELRALGLR
jgi:DNA-binding winged helix-turn-helix (wHTH) protein/TolB-like protein